MDIRPETLDDHGGIHAVHAESFQTEDEAHLVDALRSAGRLTLSLVAEEEGLIAGHVAFSPVSCAGGADGLGLAPVAVLPAFRRRGVAERLVRAGLACCREARHGFVCVLGDPGYYGRFGFVAAAQRGLRDEYGGGDAFQALELRPHSIPAAGGLVRYAAEFASLGGEGAPEGPG